MMYHLSLHAQEPPDGRMGGLIPVDLSVESTTIFAFYSDEVVDLPAEPVHYVGIWEGAKLIEWGPICFAQGARSWQPGLEISVIQPNGEH